MPFNRDEFEKQSVMPFDYESGRWLGLGRVAYFLPNNNMHSWYVEEVKGGFDAVMDKLKVERFPTLKEAQAYVESTYELSV